MKKIYPIVMLGSGAGSTIEFFCRKSQSEALSAQIVSIITDNPTSHITVLSKKLNIPCHIIPFKDADKFDEQLLKVLLSYQPELILLAGFLKKIGPKVLMKFKNRIVNSHPALIPDFSGAGMYGSRIHKAVIDQKKKETGVTIHLVNQNYDEGRILHQEVILVKEREKALELEERVQKIEKDVYLKTVLQIVSGKMLL